jgi:hypothetical protein
MKKIKYNDMAMKDKDVDAYLTKAQKKLPIDLQKKIIKSKKKDANKK